MKKSVVVILHFVYWCLYLFLLALLQLFMWVDRVPRSRPIYWVDVCLFFIGFAVLPAMFGFYSFYTVLFTKYLKAKRTLAFLLGAAFLTLCSGLFGTLNLVLLHCFHLGPSLFTAGFESGLPIIIIICINGLLNGGMGLITRGFVSWYNDIKLKEDLYKKNLETELALVKSQIDPHFLFNTINNIDVLIGCDQALASEYLNKLSEMMRYMLYETKSGKVHIHRELNYIERYIDLQRIRTANSNFIRYEAVIAAPDWEIAPMLYIPFIENAFKHAAHLKSGSAIRIHINATEDLLIFECSNKYSLREQQDTKPGGIGNDLIRKRIMLLYPDSHQLEISDSDLLYTVTLTLHRNAH